jgi:hypothetical protein
MGSSDNFLCIETWVSGIQEKDNYGFKKLILQSWIDNAELLSRPIPRVDAFFGLMYWRRVWIIQEITVAVKFTVVYGDFEFAWDDLVAILSFLRDSATSSEIFYQNSFSYAIHLLDFRDRYFIKPQPISLLEAMAWSHKSLATDSRDKIFALLGLCYDGSTFVPVPNYKQPLELILA